MKNSFIKKNKNKFVGKCLYNKMIFLTLVPMINNQEVNKPSPLKISNHPSAIKIHTVDG
jgi:hypothetical protein